MASKLFKPDTAFPDGSTGLQRFGLLFWWGACGIAAVIVLVTLGDWVIDGESNEAVAISLAFAAIVWLLGRAGLFLFASR